jgi:ATP-binding cassette subfamily B protein/subfamily B ATP-binding cassette protein MsbA
VSLKKLIRAFAFFAPERNRIIFAIFLLVLSVGANLLKPWPLALIVDNVLGNKPFPPALARIASGHNARDLLAMCAAAIFVLYAAQGALSSWQNYISIKTGLAGLSRVRTKLFAWLQKLSLRYYHDANQADIIYRSTWDTYAFQTLFQQGLFTFLNAFLSLAVMIVVMWQVNRPLTLASLTTFPFLLLTMKYFGRKMQQCSTLAHKADSDVASSTQQTIQTLTLIQSCTREAYEEEQFDKQVKNAFEKRISQHGWEVLYGFTIAAIFGAGTAGIVWLGSAEVSQGSLTVGKLLIFVAYLAQLYEPLNQLSRVGGSVAEASASVQRVFEILDTPEEVMERKDARPAVPARVSPSPAANTLLVRGEIAYQGVSFGYRPGQTVLKNISFTARAGESMAIIGPSGAGKSTLLGLLPRFFDPASGAVFLDGCDLRDLRLHDLRSCISLVLQEPILLRATVAENIAYGRPGAALTEIEAAAREANAHDFIMGLPDEYATKVGESAARLSVGEKQRINLARAFLKNAPILLLDEPTSALDAETEELVVASLSRLMQSRTTIVVAHRLSTIRQVHKVIALKDGSIAEEGTPENLLRQPAGYYARLNEIASR